MFTVHLPDGNKVTVDADKKEIRDGVLTLLRMGRIGKYKCPIRLETVATFVSWTHVTTDKEHS